MAPASISDAARQRQFVTCTGPPAAPLPAPGDGAAWARPRWSQRGTSGLAAPTGDSSWSRMWEFCPQISRAFLAQGQLQNTRVR